MKISGTTLVYGIIGNPIEHTLSPLLHNYYFSEIGYNAVYVPFKLDFEFSKKNCFKNTIKSLSIQGLSITIPYKKLGYLISDQRDSLTELTLSCNTIRIKNQFYGYNTDGIGAIKAILTKSNIDNKNILILGYGGAASAISGAILIHHKPKGIFITGRDKNKGKQLVKLLNKKIQHQSKIKFIEKEHKEFVPENFDIIINTTPLGMKGYPYKEFPLPENFILKNHIIMDIIYNPIETPLLQFAKRKKATVIEGYWMFLFQAIEQMKIFTDNYPDHRIIEKLKKLLLKNLK
ncbi:MAG: shikimate dehydrogenase [Leptonema sp. (in: bacteria)]